MIIKNLRLPVFILLALLFTVESVAQPPVSVKLSKSLYGFNHPQDSTRTKVWWFHGENETTRYGITTDLEALKKAGIGGVVYYDQVFGNQQQALPAMSPEWWEMLKFSAKEAQRIGLRFEAHVSNGYVAGGPWIKYEDGMKRLVATESLIHGGQPIQVTLAALRNSYTYSKDVVVLAFPAPEGGGGSSQYQHPQLSSNISGIDAAAMVNPAGSLVKVPQQANGQSVYININFQENFTARSITYQVKPSGKATSSATNVPGPPGPIFVGTGYKVLPVLGQLEISQDGKNYTRVCDLYPVYKAHESWQQKTLAFPKVQAKYYRLNLHDWAEGDAAKQDLFIGNVVMSSDAHLDQWEEKAGLFSEYIENDHTPPYVKNEVIQPAQVINLTTQMDTAGVLRWNAPKGNWVVMRFAQVATGGRTKHGRNNLMGLECDKMSAKAATLQFTHYFKPILDSLRSIQAPLAGMAMDSHEAGAQNWTDEFLTEFERRRGYALLPYLPVMWGHVVASSEISAKVLYDVRRTIADLIADNYYGTFQKLCSQEGVAFTAQATGNALCIVADPIQAKSKVEIPQGEFWIIHPEGNYDIKEASSSAHLYGKPIASGEAFTGALYNHTLSDLKNIADGAYAFGINEFVVCASAYQPWDSTRLPGNVARGLEWVVNRNNTWWNFSRDFWDYQARCAYLLRLGRPVVDLCVYLGDNAPVKILTYRLPEIPTGYYFDAFTQDALLTRMRTTDGKVELPDGISYGMMVLPRSGEITYAALKKIADLVKNGAKVWGNRPVGSPSKTDARQRAAYAAIVHALWDKRKNGSKTFGKGTVYWGMSLAEAIQKTGMKPDIQVGNGNSNNEKLYYVHRELNDADLYFINNHKDTIQSGEFTFRSGHPYVQLWNPVTGKRFSVSVLKKTKNTVTVQLALAARESYFVVCSDTAETLSALSLKQPDKEQAINTDWKVYFNEHSGGPGWVTLSKLTDWTKNEQPNIRFYSGTAVYTKELEVEQIDSTQTVLIKLQQLNSVSDVFVNGERAGTIWCSPWEIDITPLLKKGKNTIEIRIANTWINRLIGDAALPEKERITWTNFPIAQPTDKLQPSGLIDVRLLWKSLKN